MKDQSEIQSCNEPTTSAEVIKEQSEPRPLPECGGVGGRSNTRVGKIARLPHQIREQLNHRLADGEVGRYLVMWLNCLPEVRAVLAEKFGGRPINEQNLTEWKQGGFEEWLRQQEASAWMQTLAEEDDELKTQCGPVPLAERLTNTMLFTLGRVLREISASPAGPEQVKMLLSVADRLVKVRRGEVAADRARLERERWEAAQEEVREEKRKAAEKIAAFEQIMGSIIPRQKENPAAGSDRFLTPEITDTMSISDLHRIAIEQIRAHANQGESNQIKPDQGGETEMPPVPTGSAGASPSQALSGRMVPGSQGQGAGAPSPQVEPRGGGAPAPCGSLRNDPDFHKPFGDSVVPPFDGSMPSRPHKAPPASNAKGGHK